MDTTTALNDMSKQIDELRSSKNQQIEEIRKQAEATSDVTDGTPQPKGPPDRFDPVHSTSKPTPTNNNPSVHHGLSSRLTKIGFPMFDGSELREWIYRCEQFFSIDSTPPELKVRLASLHMTGKALQWHHSYIANRYNQFPLWPEYLVSLKQGNDSIDAYLDKFDCAMTRITLAPGHALSIFLTNMNQHLALHVRQFNVNTVPAAAKIAKLHDLSLSHAPTKTSRPAFNSAQRSNFSQPNKSQYNTMTSLAANTHTAEKGLFEEMQEQKRKGLCMYCEEPFTPRHHLKHRPAEFLFLDADTEFDEEIALVEKIRETILDDEDDKVPTISVHALNGSPTFNSMRLMGQYEKRKLHILVSQGAHTTFLTFKLLKDSVAP
ncbi:hypothetical protein Bca52824_022501 [Brassica carinata]|uniref:Retrotransposon gag domain-containing protein n=1 Tax=Brassica carinata TaxID=52824 RepID=A0A8X8ARE9_BRACI|nr:hypothetical protein Bca52824_022501 [Brassica carinata]